jgi:hypothetical protein
VSAFASSTFSKFGKGYHLFEGSTLFTNEVKVVLVIAVDKLILFAVPSLAIKGT